MLCSLELQALNGCLMIKTYGGLNQQWLPVCSSIGQYMVMFIIFTTGGKYVHNFFKS